ncbi:MAG: long-chain-acyl-CoA synthetase [Actinomycetota bacterium]
MDSPGRLSIKERIESDLRMVRALAKITPNAARSRGSSTSTVADRWEAIVDKHPHRVAMIDASDGGREVTFTEIDNMANQVAGWAQANELGQGDVVALLMMNRPEYVATWLGLAKLGIATALINTNLTGEPLRHSVSVSGARHLIVDNELTDAWSAARGDEAPVELEFEPGYGAVADHATARPDPSVREGLTCADRLFYIYTSGTTGLPKAASFSHSKFLTVSSASAGMTDVDIGDRMYITLPLYHTAGGVMALGGALMQGTAAITTRKFSASRFWEECVEYGATTFQYIGELCRYLVNSDPHPLETEHALRVCVGNGLRPDVWPEFQERFKIPKIVEFYGATEGTGSLINLDNRIGAIGRMRPQLAKRLGLHIVKYDVDADEIVRDDKGRVIDCAPNEPGEFISRITNITPFEGYEDEEATEKKILRDAFSDGDAYFRSGDLLSQDEDGYYYFIDRIGDTFRWKGENVSTAEVAAQLGGCPGVDEANVYGVEVPGTDGRAGMATLVVDDTFDVATLAAHSAENLPAYARPLFLRIQTELEITGTFKHRKVDSVKEGFDPITIDDPLWFFDPGEKAYVPLDPPLFGRITAGEVRF